MNKKKLLAIVLFLIFGFTIYTFANPTPENEKLDGDEKTQQQEQTNIGEDNNNTVVENNPMQNLNATNNNLVAPVATGALNNLDNANTPSIIPTLTINENNIYTMEINSDIPEFVAQGFAGEEEINVKISNDINPAKAGKYTVTFEVTYDGNTVKIEKGFEVIDSKAPVFVTEDKTIGKNVTILVEDDSEVIIKVYNKTTNEIAYIENGKSISLDGEYVIVATDESGNSSEITIIVDNNKPIITLNGNKEVVIRINNNYNDLGAKAIDDVDGDITDKIVTDSNVNTKLKGNYTVKYNVEDSAKNKADEVERIVYVVSTSDLKDAIDEGNKILDLVNHKELDDELNNLIEELEKLIDEGNNIIDDKNSKQDVIDSKEEEINELINKINDLKFVVKYVDYNDKEIVSYDVELGKPAPVPANPTRVGYDFIGWDSQATFVTKNITIKAQYLARNDTNYVVKTYFEKLDGSFEKPITETYKGISDAIINNLQLNDYEGFVTPKVDPFRINADGKTTVIVKYFRTKNNVVFKINGNVYKTYTNVKFGEKIDIPKYSPNEGYTLVDGKMFQQLWEQKV